MSTLLDRLARRMVTEADAARVIEHARWLLLEINDKPFDPELAAKLMACIVDTPNHDKAVESVKWIVRDLDCLTFDHERETVLLASARFLHNVGVAIKIEKVIDEEAA